MKRNYELRYADFIPFRGLFDYELRNGVPTDYSRNSLRVRNTISLLEIYNGICLIGALAGAAGLISLVIKLSYNQ